MPVVNPCLAVLVPHDPGSWLPSHHASDLCLKAAARLERVLLQGEDVGGEHDLDLDRGRLPLALWTDGGAVVVARILYRHVGQLNLAPLVVVGSSAGELAAIPSPLNLSSISRGLTSEPRLTTEWDTDHCLGGVCVDREDVGHDEGVPHPDHLLNHDPTLVLTGVFLDEVSDQEDAPVFLGELKPRVLLMADAPGE